VPETDDEIEHLAVTVNEMLDRIDRSRIAQRQFTSDAAHELRTPLMAIQGELELARTTLAVDDPGLPERLDALLERLRVRIDDLVLLSTLDEGRPPATEPFSARALADEEARTVGADVHGVDVEIVADRSLVEHALGNLLGNARRHARERVDLTVRVDSGRVWFDVDDDGPGIAPADREHLFRRFARLDEARTIDRGGAGLGLAIVASVAAAHDGGVDVATSPGGGARLSLWLPIAGAAAD
jgi:signal transduction histidine kinase